MRYVCVKCFDFVCYDFKSYSEHMKDCKGSKAKKNVRAELSKAMHDTVGEAKYQPAAEVPIKAVPAVKIEEGKKSDKRRRLEKEFGEQ